MKHIQAYTYELKPKGEHLRKLRMYAGSSRYVYNKALALQQSRYAQGEKKLSYAGLCKEITQWRHHPETVWLSQTPAQVLQQSMKDLEAAYQHFLEKRHRFPRFKKKGVRESLRFPQGFKVEQHNNRIYLPKVGWIGYRNSRRIEGTIKQITVKLTDSKWFVSITTEQDIGQPTHPSSTAIGVDMGIVRFATLSDGTFIEPIHSLKHYQRQLARAQRAQARKIKNSQNWRKQKEKIARIHRKIAHIRKDYLHKTSTFISKNHAMIFLEDLQIRHMSKSVKGTRDNPGRNVRAKSALNRSILDQGWGEFRRQLAYKQAWRGGSLCLVPARNTSRTCPCCGHVSAESRKTQAVFRCIDCGYEGHADHVAAINVLRAGHAQLACGENVRLGVEQSTSSSLCEAGTHRSDISSHTDAL